ncbi:MAG: anti-sigma factor antagonist [Ruminiclostridium sp.]|nr:anti-sigma factor antagonist [Ruminiclostridium sp.]
MIINTKQEKNVLTVFLKGELDHHTASKVRDTIDMEILKTSVKLLIIDMGEVSFMDSSGIGLIVGRYHRIKRLGGNMQIINPSASLLRILRMSGVEKIIKIS